MSLFEPLRQRDVSLRNRLVVSPMCQYSATDGLPNEWHLVHLGSRAVGGAGLVIAEASAVSAEGRISLGDVGLWNDAQRDAWATVTRFIRAEGAVAGIQLAHAGRKGSTGVLWQRDLVTGDGPLSEAQGGWPTLAPSTLPFDEGWPSPHALDAAGIATVIAQFRAAAARALDAGFQLIELHAAHGYLLHQFLSPLSNQREDAYGGSFDHRIRLVLEVIAAVREVWPATLPLWLRISATDWAEGGWDIEQSVALARGVGELGVDLVDVSSGGLLPHVRIPIGPGYQVPFAARIRAEAAIATGAVGLITEPGQAAAIIEQGQADVVLLARESLRDPYFPRRAAKVLGERLSSPKQYLRAW